MAGGNVLLEIEDILALVILKMRFGKFASSIKYVECCLQHSPCHHSRRTIHDSGGAFYSPETGNDDRASKSEANHPLSSTRSISFFRQWSFNLPSLIPPTTAPAAAPVPSPSQQAASGTAMTMTASPRPTHLDHMWELNAAGRETIRKSLLASVESTDRSALFQGYSRLQHSPTGSCLFLNLQRRI
jgi:hypothetical protein